VLVLYVGAGGRVVSDTRQSVPIIIIKHEDEKRRRLPLDEQSSNSSSTVVATHRTSCTRAARPEANQIRASTTALQNATNGLLALLVAFSWFLPGSLPGKQTNQPTKNRYCSKHKQTLAARVLTHLGVARRNRGTDCPGVLADRRSRRSRRVLAPGTLLSAVAVLLVEEHQRPTGAAVSSSLSPLSIAVQLLLEK